MRRFECLLLLVCLLGAIGLTNDPGNAGQTSLNQQPSANSPHLRKNQYQFGNRIFTIDPVKPRFHHLSKQRVQLNLHQLKSQTLHDIRIERAEHVSTGITLDPKLSRLAKIRARQIAKHFSHYNLNHEPMTTVDARQAGLPSDFQGSENIASNSLGNCTVIADPKTYHNHNGKDMANMSNDAMMNYDAFEQNGHRKNILSSDNTLLGIGAYYSHHTHTFYLVEDFGNQNPRSSEDVKRQRMDIHLKSPHQVIFKALWQSGQKWFHHIVHMIKERI